MQAESSIALVDNTLPFQPSDDESPRSPSVAGPSSLSRRITRGSARQRRKYAKWQPDKLGLADDDAASRAPSRSEQPPTDRNGDRTRSGSRGSESQEDRGIDTTDFTQTGRDNRADEPSQTAPADTTSHSELDVLYENQRGWFFFGIPLYSHKSLLNFDPSPWVTRDFKDSPVDITNAQVPDPSWEWAWKTWYVDMSGDVDEEGWQYSFSFAAKKAWHGTQPWFHSFVRRRRWVKLRVKKVPARRDREGRTGFEMAHMLNDDYFTIHPTLVNVKSSESSTGPTNGVEPDPVGKRQDEEVHFEEIGDIPTLMQALKHTIVDREKLEALKRFVDQGGEELYYLPEKIPEIMSLFIFQSSRWQFFTYLQDMIEETSKEIPAKEDPKDAEVKKRRLDNLVRAAETVRHHTTGPDVFSDPDGTPAGDKLDLTPARGQHGLSSYQAKRGAAPVASEMGNIKGIPEEAGIDSDGGHLHIRQG